MIQLSRKLNDEIPLFVPRQAFQLDPFLMDIEENFDVKERLPIFGKCSLWLHDLKGRIVDERHTPNDIVDGGEIWIAELLAGEAYDGSALTYSAGQLGHGLQYTHIGEDGSATTQGMFAMQDTTSVTTFYSSTTNDVDDNGNKVICTSTYTTADGIGDLQEAGLQCSTNYATSKTDEANRMFNRVNFATIGKTTDFSLTLQWTITIGTV